jgi:hypothetical protein
VTVVLASSIDVATAHGAVTVEYPNGTWSASSPYLGGVAVSGCGSEDEALSECGDLIRIHDARQARGAVS